MKNSLRNFCLILPLLISTSLWAGPLEEIILTTWNTDPMIHSQESVIKAAELERFARFLPNNPTITFAEQDNSSWRTWGASLQIGLPGKAFALGHVDREVVRAEQNELIAKKIELASFVVEKYTSCALNKALTEILEEAVNELNVLFQTITARYEMGQSTQAERIGIELQHRQASIELRALKDQEKVSCAKFGQFLLERKIDPSLIETIALDQDLDEKILSQLGSRSLDVIRAENDIRLADANQSVAFWRSAPDFTVSYYRNNYNQVRASPIIPIQWTNTWLVQMNIPLLFPFYERSEILRERAAQMISSRRAFMRKLDSERSAEDAANTFRRNKEILIKLQKHDLPMAETMLDSTLASYKQGKLGFSELILAKRTWLDLRKEEVNLKYNLLNSRLICLNTCEGK